MSSPIVDLAHRKGTGNAAVGTCAHALLALPVTAAVILGPFIAVAYNLTQPIDARTGGFGVGQAARGFLCALMLLTLFLSRGLRPLTHRLARPLLFLGAYALATSLLRPYPYHHVVFAVKMAFVAALFASARQWAQEGLVGERWLAICTWVVLLTTATCIGIGLITGRSFAVYETRFATAGLMDHAAVASMFVLSALPVLIRYFAVRRAALAGIVIVYLSLFFTMCRNAIIAGVVATGCSFLMNLNPFGGRIPWRRILPSLAVLVLLVGIGLNTAAGADLIARFRDLNPREGTGSGRYVFWRIILTHIRDRPIPAQVCGEGMGCVKDLLRERFGLAISSHNDGLDFIYAFGLFGLIGMGWWCFEVARFVLSFRGGQEGLLPGVCAAVIILGLWSAGTSGFFEPPWALIYAAMGFWAGHTARTNSRRWTREDENPVLEE